MKTFNQIKKGKGQAIVETLLSIPLLFLFAAGIVQFSILFLSYVQFEHACGEAARQYAAGIVEKTSMEKSILENLGSFRRYFDPQSLTAAIQEPRSKAASALVLVRSAAGIIPGVLRYDGAEWIFKIRCRPPFFFALLFPKGILFETTLQIFRYPP